jgi:uncharacterized protein
VRTSPLREYREPQVERAHPPGRTSTGWVVVATVEVGLAAAAVILDLAIPTFVILALMAVSLLIRREGLSSLGLHRVSRVPVLAGKMLALAAGWTLLDVGLLKPIEKHLAGAQQDMSQFSALQGNLGMLLTWIVLAWVVAGFGETLAFVGFIQTRITDVIGSTGARLGLAVVLSSVLLGLLHTEYGIVGVTVSAINGIFYCALRYRYTTLWAPILAHGFIDTIGLVSFFLVGPIYGLW